jgi:hypothetical protein
VTAAEAFVSKLATIPSVDPGDNDLILTKPAVPEHIVSEKDINSADGPDRRRSPAGTMPDVTLAEAEDARTTRGSRADLPPANWYRDPTGNAQWRWWDGQKWTEHIA